MLGIPWPSQPRPLPPCARGSGTRQRGPRPPEQETPPLGLRPAPCTGIGSPCSKATSGAQQGGGRARGHQPWASAWRLLPSFASSREPSCEAGGAGGAVDLCSGRGRSWPAADPSSPTLTYGKGTLISSRHGDVQGSTGPASRPRSGRLRQWTPLTDAILHTELGPPGPHAQRNMQMDANETLIYAKQSINVCPWICQSKKTCHLI